MKTFNLSFNPEDIREIYDLGTLEKERKSLKTFIPLLGALGAISTAVYWIFKEEDANKEFTIVAAFAFAIYMVHTFWKTRKSYNERINDVESLIEKNVIYTSNVLSINNSFLQFEQDDILVKHNLSELLTFSLEEKYMSFKFKEGLLLFPKKAFQPGEWDLFLMEIRNTNIKK